MLRRRRRRTRSERIDPFGVGPPWRRFVQGALQAQARYERTVAGMSAGPLRERLDDIGRCIDQITQECWLVAQQGEALEEALSALAPAAAGANVAPVGGAQAAAVERLSGLVTEVRRRLARLEAGLGLAAAGAVELSAGTFTDADPSGLGRDVDQLVDDIVALRAALDETAALEA